VLTFQVVWNLNHPDDRIDEDGLYGPMTASRVAASPAGGFGRDACTCDAGCDGTTIVGTNCSRTDCASEGAICSTGLGAPACVAAACVASPTEVPRARDVCLEDGRLGHCTELGTLESIEQCAAGDSCIPIDGEAMCASMDRDAGVVSGDAGSLPAGSDAGPGDGSRSSVSGGCSASSSEGAWLAGLALIALARRRRRSR
jgi:MYXO-CTERM domain-containing protein